MPITIVSYNLDSGDQQHRDRKEEADKETVLVEVISRREEFPVVSNHQMHTKIDTGQGNSVPELQTQ